jgi:predicted negative regulator of RcsB-dependent stress response
MVDDYLSDREQEEALRNWWRENWPWIIGGIVLGLALLGGWRYWNAYRDQRAAEAASMYEHVRSALEKQDIADATKSLESLAAKFDKSAYTQQGRLLIAKAEVDAGKYDEALVQLRAVAEKAKDKELADIAQLRIARVLLQQGKHDDALNQLKPDALGMFSGPAREIRGDALVAKGDAEGARAEYAAALSGDNAAIDRNLIELKLQDVGGGATPSSNVGTPPMQTSVTKP